ncbi:50S ribosomal protein L31 [Nitrolancea hollandica Lb]|uniref:50S ribosomal protein L31 n=1 Tax=Nitrolancea hollandica Lb TaxID=1129897 RepID=I4EDG6_9BACT|nr:50S ribosomal protein L31 [Nitrolancea hollandica Lb]
MTCACGNTWVTRSTKAQLRIDLCSQCHPFYTGDQRIVDTAGQVERFMKRLEAASEAPRRKKAERRQKKLEQRARSRRQEEQLLVTVSGEEEPEPES